jgi:hypothetical protein
MKQATAEQYRGSLVFEHGSANFIGQSDGSLMGRPQPGSTQINTVLTMRTSADPIIAFQNNDSKCSAGRVRRSN